MKEKDWKSKIAGKKQTRRLLQNLHQLAAALRLHQE